MKGATRGLREGWMEGNYLKLMPGLIFQNSNQMTGEVEDWQNTVWKHVLFIFI